VARAAPAKINASAPRRARRRGRKLLGVQLGRRRIEESDMKSVFTTGEAAEICKVSQQTIIRCFDSGRLKGFRVPGSRFRRIPRESLLQFMKDNGIPPDALDNGKTKVLVVDDDPEIVELFVDVLERDGRFEVKTAATGYDAGMITQEFNPDLVILDYMLPDINGNVVCKTIRQKPEFEHTKIIIVSGVVNQDEINELLKAGADEFVKKPFNIEKLIERIGELLTV
jgi:excisionase family DNA binding protein